MKKLIAIIIVVVVILGVYATTTYNSLVSLSVSADTQWKQVEVDYQRRFDLIPNLVASAKGVMKQEVAVFTAIADAIPNSKSGNGFKYQRSERKNSRHRLSSDLSSKLCLGWTSHGSH
jgi:hypothetical protein